MVKLIDCLPTSPVPGMPVEAFIRTSDRSPLSYLVKPDRLFRKSIPRG